MSKTKSTTDTIIEIKAEKETNNIGDSNVTLLDFMAGIAFLGYAVNKFEDFYVPEGSTLGKEISRESYAWARAMCKGKEDYVE